MFRLALLLFLISIAHAKTVFLLPIAIGNTRYGKKTEYNNGCLDNEYLYLGKDMPDEGEWELYVSFKLANLPPISCATLFLNHQPEDQPISRVHLDLVEVTWNPEKDTQKEWPHKEILDFYSYQNVYMYQMGEVRTQIYFDLTEHISVARTSETITFRIYSGYKELVQLRKKPEFKNMLPSIFIEVVLQGHSPTSIAHSTQ
jgi:hypothetical protein